MHGTLSKKEPQEDPANLRDDGEPEARKKEKKKKKEKRPFMHGTRERLTTAYGLGRTLVEEPRSFPAQVQLQLLKWARATWNARGGGFYACGFVVTFVLLEIKLLFTELLGSSDAAGFVVGQVLQLLMRFTVDSFVNTIKALLWPVFILELAPVWGLAGLVVAYFVFSRFLKEPLTRLLFDNESDPPQ